MIIRESQLPVCRCELTLPPPGSSLSLRSFLPAFLSCPSSPSLPPPPSILRPGPFTLVTYPSPLTDTDRYQMNVFPGRRQWISGVMRHSAGTPSRHCLRVLVRLRVWSKKVFGTSLTGHSHAHPPFFLVLYMYHQVCWFILCTYLYIFPPSYTLKLQKGLPAPHC